MLNKEKYKKRISPLLIILGIILVIYSISLLLSLYWAVITSFKSRIDINRVVGYKNNLFAFPSNNPDCGWRFDNYAKLFTFVFTDRGVPFRLYELFLNSIAYAIGCAFFAVFANVLVAYAISTFKFKFSGFLYRLIIICMAIPIVGTEASALQLTSKLKIYDTLFGMYLLKGGFIGMYTLIVYEAFSAVPRSFSEAAEIDGASHLKIFLSIAIPMVKNVLATIFILYFIQFWNDYQTPLLFMPSKPTLAYAIYKINNYQQSVTSEYKGVPFLLAMSMVLMLPILTLFVIFNKRIMGNVSLGGIKE